MILTKRKDTFECDSESEAMTLINDAKSSTEYELKKYSNEKKVNKKTGDEYYIVSLEKIYE